MSNQEAHILQNILATAPGNILVINIPNREVAYSNVGPQYWGFEWQDDGKRLYELFRDRIHKDETPQMLALLEEIQNTPDNEVLERQFRFVAADGQTKWINMRNKVFRRNEAGAVVEFVAFIYDISSQKEIEYALRRSQELHNAILNALPDLKFHVDKNGVIIDYYPSGAEDDLLLPPEVFLGKNVKDLLPPVVAEASLANVKKAIQSRIVQSYEYFLPMPGGISFYEGRCCAVNDEEAVVVVRNITERKKTYESLQGKIRELDVKNRELAGYVASNAALENFAYIASHDLREPLRTMRTFAQLMQKKYSPQLDETGCSYLDFIANGANNLNNLIEDLLEYAKVNSEPLAASNEDPAELIEEVLQNLSEYMAQKNASIIIESLPSTMTVNPTKFKQLIQNMLANAIKFAKPDTPPQIKIWSEDKPGYWQFSIADNGIGVALEFQDKIFELFKKLHPKGQFEGTGLGLAICKKIVEQHQGRIWVESIPNEGATFYFTISQPSAK